MTITFGKTKNVRELAHKIFWQAKARADREQAEYDEMVRECAEQGFRPHHCIHGTDQWTDYDNICGPCEDEQKLWDDARDWATAKSRAEETFRLIDARTAVAEQAFALDKGNNELIDFMFNWIWEPYTRFKFDK